MPLERLSGGKTREYFKGAGSALHYWQQQPISQEKPVVWVHCASLGELIRPGYLTNHFHLLLEENGLRHIRFHDLRHTVASLLVNNGVPIKNVSDYLGHKDIQVTANIYGHLDKTSKEISANVINNVLSMNV